MESYGQHIEEVAHRNFGIALEAPSRRQRNDAYVLIWVENVLIVLDPASNGYLRRQVKEYVLGILLAEFSDPILILGKLDHFCHNVGSFGHGCS
jgi:hypothetical protein